MAIHESNVNYCKLINDLAEMYPFEVDEVVISELVANSLDAKANIISIDYNNDNNILVITDNGNGMSSTQFEEYHDFATGLKTRGSSIGFAGVGAKISFNIANCVVAETQSKTFSGGSTWYLEDGKKLFWEDIVPSHLSGNGTRVEVHFNKGIKPSYTKTEDIIQILQRHYLPLFDIDFIELYKNLSFYPEGITFKVNGQVIKPISINQGLGLKSVKIFKPQKASKKIGYGVFGLSEMEYPLGIDISGVLLCTHGKVIKSDFFNQFPGNIGPRIFGLVEIPDFVNFLTTSKTDFIRTRGKHKNFEGLYDPIRQEFKSWLMELGVQPIESINADEALKLERELKKLTEEIPELSEFFGAWSKKNILVKISNGIINGISQEGGETTSLNGQNTGGGNTGTLDTGNGSCATFEKKSDGTEKLNPIGRTVRRGPKISFMSVPDRIDLAWVEGNYVVINSGHPSYIRISSNTTAKKTHCLFAIGTAIQKFMSSSSGDSDLTFIDRLMSAWGRK